MSASQQEALLAAAAGSSFGSFYLFEPDSYYKGKAIREPADLAWVCRGTVFLFNMQESKKDFNHQLKHNSDQLFGWLRAWRSGRHLIGRNSSREFDILIDKVENVVLVSINSGADSQAHFHWDLMRDRRNHGSVSAIVSIPQTVMLSLFQWGGTALDFCDYILHLATLPRPIPEDAALGLLSEQHVTAVASVRAVMGAVDERDDELDTNVSQVLIHSIRNLSMEHVTLNGSAIDEGPSIFNDLDWTDNARLIFTISNLTRSVRDVEIGAYGPVSALAALDLGYYVFILVVMDMTKPQTIMQNYEEVYQSYADRDPALISNLMVGRPAVEFYSQIFTLPKQSRPSVVSHVLGQLSPELEGCAIVEHGYANLAGAAEHDSEPSA